MPGHVVDARPLWLLDVDGVLNAGKPDWGAAPCTATVYAQGAFRMRWAPALMARIRGLLGDAEIRWASTWIGATAQLAAMFALPDFPAAYEPPPRLDGPSHAGLKLRAALDAVEAGRRLVWTDDDAIPLDGASRADLEEAGALLIAPRSNRGLQPEHLDAIEAFVRHRHPPGGSSA